MRLGHAVLVLAASLHAQAANLFENDAPAGSVNPGIRGRVTKAGALADDPPAGLSRADWTQIRRSIEQSEYQAMPVSRPGKTRAIRAPNRRQAYRTTFRREGIEIVPQPQASARWRLGLSVTGYGYEDDVRSVAPADPSSEKDRVEYRRGLMTEWYLNRPDGLEQGFTLEQPARSRAGSLVIAMTVQGDLDVSARADAASFTDPSGTSVVRYAGLKAWDADARPLPARFEAEGRQLRLIVEARAVRFPVTVDPIFVHEVQLHGTIDPVGKMGAAFGFSVSLDGETLVIGTPGDGEENQSGAAYVFVRSGTTWTFQQRLFASDDTEYDGFAQAVSVSGDTVMVGAPSVCVNPPYCYIPPGAVYVFTRSGTTWTEQQKIQASDAVHNDYFGWAVSVSADTAVVGGYNRAAYVFVRSGASWTEQQKLVPSDGWPTDWFGVAVSVAGDTIVAGAPRDDTGAAYVFVRTGTVWTEEQKLLASDGGSGDEFGNTVSISGETIAVGAHLDDNSAGQNAGAAYVFVRSGTTWAEQQKLTASDGAGFDVFGEAVSISGDTVVVGAVGDDTPANQAGSAYVFVRSGTTWTEQQKLIPSDAEDFANFGQAVSVSGDTVAVGAPGDDTLGGSGAGTTQVFVRSATAWTLQQQLLGFDTAGPFGDSVSMDGDTLAVSAPGDVTSSGIGSAYMFVRSGAGWTEPQKLTTSDVGASANFGYTVSVSGDTVVVGAPYADTPGQSLAGSAYVFVRAGTTWSKQQKLVASDGAASDFFGFSVSVSGDTAVVGAMRDDTAGGVDAGSAYVFVRAGTTWTEQQKLVASDGGTEDEFGRSVSVSGNTALIGAPSDNSGSAYVFVRSGSTWAEQQKLLGGNSFGNSVAVSGDTAVVGAWLDFLPGGSDYPGSAYVFVRSGTTWTQQQKLLASDGASDDWFGYAVALSADRIVVGALHDTTPAGEHTGSAYVFDRSGAVWTEQQKLLAPDAAAEDRFGDSVAAFGGTVVIGAPSDGSAHVFGAEADLGVTKTDGQTTAVPGEPLTYTITASNAGPNSASGANVTDILPAALLAPTWSCVASPGSTCTAGGSGNINDTVDLAVGGTVTYTVLGTVAPGATGTISNTTTVILPGGLVDPNPGNNSATDVDVLAPTADLSIVKTDSADPVAQNDPLTYTLSITNNGPSDATGVTVTDTLPSGVTFVSSVPGSPTCNLAGATLTCDLGALAAGGNSTVTIDTTVNAASGMLVNSASVSASEPDPDTRNNAASAATSVGRTDGELAQGTDALYDLSAQPGPAPDEDVFRIKQKPYSSYEVVVDATSGDIGAGAGPLLQRMAPDGTTVLQDSAAIGTGPSRSLRWANMTSGEVEGETVRVRSAECGTDCGPDDVYRIRAYETTYTIPRFNNAGTQVTVLILQNPADYPVSGEIYFRDSAGLMVAAKPFSLDPKATLVLNTATVPGVNGVSGAMSIAHDARYGDLSGKTVALEPATGFSFDSPMEPRLR